MSMDKVKSVPFAIFETEEGQFIGKFHVEDRTKAIRVRNYLEEQVKILRGEQSKCHRLRTILENRGVKRHGRRERKI